MPLDGSASELVETLRSLLLHSEPPSFRPAIPAHARALHRLLSGAGGAADEAALAVVLSGARVVRVAATAAGSRIALREQPLSISCEGGSLHLVSGGARLDGEDRALRAARRCAALVRTADPHARIGISGPVRTRHELESATGEAVDAAALTTDEQPIVLADESWVELELLRLRPHLGRGNSNPIQRLLDYDVDRGSELTRTLGVWLAQGRDLAQTSAVLDIHKNTVRYRIRRACEVAELDLTDQRQVAILSLLLS
jgi:hypothetical protein